MAHGVRAGEVLLALGRQQLQRRTWRRRDATLGRAAVPGADLLLEYAMLTVDGLYLESHNA